LICSTRSYWFELAAGKVNAHREGFSLTRHTLEFAKLAARLRQHNLAERHDQVGFFGNVNELGRRDKSAFRVIPANKSFETRDRIAGSSMIGW